MKRVYLHGLGQAPDSWYQTLELTPTAQDAVCPDLATIAAGSEIDYSSLYSAFSRLCDSFKGPIDLCGLSLGGVLALNYAIERPDKVNSLVLIAAQYKMPKKLLRLQNALFRLMPKSGFCQTGFEKADFLRLCRSMMDLDLTQSLDKVTCPVLIICGEKDSSNRRASEALAGLLSHVKLKIIGGAGHEVNIDAPGKLAEALSDFYSRHTSL